MGARTLFPMLATGLLAGCGSAPRGAAPWEASPLAGLYRLRSTGARRVSSHDRQGGDQDYLAGLGPASTAEIAEIDGPAIIRHIWLAVSGEEFHLRKLVLRMYWDGETEPSVETPLGDFFCLGHADRANLVSLPIAVSSDGRALNAYFPMPFRAKARITITNEGFEPLQSLSYAIDYQTLDDAEALGPDIAYFHAQYRQAYPCEPGADYAILDAQGRGHYIGCNLSVEQNAPGWWGEGDDRIFIDDATAPAIEGTGTGDYFCDAPGVRANPHGLYYGCSVRTGSSPPGHAKGDRTTVYRFHIEDPIPFRLAIRVAIEHGHGNDRRDNLSSVAYWYQTEPHLPFAPLPPVERRLPADARGDREYARAKAVLRRAREIGRLDAGIQALRSFTEGFPDYRRAPVALLKLAGLWKETDRAGEALSTFRTMAARYPDTIYGRIGRNEVLLSEGGAEALAAALEGLPCDETKKILRAGREGSPATGFLISGGDRPAPLATQVWADIDDAGLRIRARMEEPQLYALREAVTSRDGPVWEDDAIEFFFDPDRDYFGYRQIAVNARGTVWDGLGDENEVGRAGLWNAKVDVRVERGDGAWEVFLTIPFGAEGLPRPKPGDVWGFNARRLRRAGGRDEVWTWNYLAPEGLHQPQRFGYLFFP